MKHFSNLIGIKPGRIRIALSRNIKFTKGSNVEFCGDARFGHNTFITAIGGKIVFGHNFSGNQDVIYNSDNGGLLQFGNDCLVGPRCIFRTSNHNFTSTEKPIRVQGHISKDIKIGDDVWIGANVVVLPGVSIGNHSVIGAGSIVTKNIPENVIAVGNPARVLRFR